MFGAVGGLRAEPRLTARAPRSPGGAPFPPSLAVFRPAPASSLAGSAAPPRAIGLRPVPGGERGAAPSPPSFTLPPLPLAAEPACRARPLAARPAACPDWWAAARRPAPRGAERRVWAGELPAPLGSAGLRAPRAGRPLLPAGERGAGHGRAGLSRAEPSPGRRAACRRPPSEGSRAGRPPWQRPAAPEPALHRTAPRRAPRVAMDERFNRWLLPPLLTLLFLLIVYQYVSPACPGAACPRRPPASAARRGGDPADEEEAEEAAAALPRLVPKFPFARGELCRRVRFDMRGRDVIVFLHIQKTGGTTFGRHLVRNIRLEQPCYCRAGQKKCACHRPGGDKDTWLFSRFSTGWSCGLHADWTELTSCVPAAMERRGCAGNRTLR
uniref:Heparan-sulfate 6-O-sulfotransferase n=1 Tax=Anser brachyrhynchus TaxID=132585 RepID=A0A8B9CGW4_9AVES